MKTPAGSSLDVTLFTEAVIDSLRARLPQLVAREVRAQLDAAARGSRLTSAELRERNRLRVANGLRALPGVEIPPTASTCTRPRCEEPDESASIRSRES